MSGSSSDARMLAGRGALISGAGQGIGQGIAVALAAHGALVGIGVRRAAAGAGTAEMIAAAGGTSRIVLMDVTHTDQVEAAVAETTGAFGNLSILVHNANNAASAHPIAFEDIDDTAWHAQYDVTLGGLFRSARAAYPWLRDSGHGRLILLSSTFGYHGAAMNPIYAAQKAAERGFIKSLGREWGPDRITVNAICPSAATEPAEIFFDQHAALKAAFMTKFALQRMGSPRDDIGEAVALICNDGFGYMTTQTIHLDGGLYPAA